jgi:hypothetical protein
MDILETIHFLRLEKAKLEAVIAALEELQQESSSRRIPHLGSRRRGRKSMGAQERREVSERMKRYWAGRSQQKNKRTKPPVDPNGGVTENPK